MSQLQISVLLGFILPAIVISYDARSAASLSDAVLDSSDEFIVLDSGASKCKAQASAPCVNLVLTTQGFKERLALSPNITRLILLSI